MAIRGAIVTTRSRVGLWILKRQKILDLEYQMTLFPEETKGPLSRLWQSHLGKGLWLTEARRGKVEMSCIAQMVA